MPITTDAGRAEANDTHGRTGSPLFSLLQTVTAHSLTLTWCLTTACYTFTVWLERHVPTHYTYTGRYATRFCRKHLIESVRKLMDIKLSNSAAQFDEMLYKSVGNVPCFKVNETPRVIFFTTLQVCTDHCFGFVKIITIDYFKYSHVLTFIA